MEPNRKLIPALRALAEPIVDRFGCELVAVELAGPGNRRVLRVSIDKPGGATIDDCTRISRALSPALDVEDRVSGPYDLEVSTPGMDRPLQREKDFAYFAGCDVRIRLWGMDSRRRIKARLLGIHDGVVEIENEQGRQAIPLDDIERANLVLDMDQYARLGQGLHPIPEGETP
jgi:ribosome maturation factor RimP